MSKGKFHDGSRVLQGAAGGETVQEGLIFGSKHRGW